MKGPATVILMLLLATQTFSKWMWVVDYELNKAYIAKVLCINKAKPQLKCNGRCQLSKKLAEDEKKSDTSDTAPKKTSLPSHFFKTDMESVACLWAFLPRQWRACYVIKPYASVLPAVFHPPAV